MGKYILILGCLLVINTENSGQEKRSPLTQETGSKSVVTEGNSYFPLHIGDEWDYYFAEGGITDVKPTTFYFVFDTLCLNGKKYFIYGENIDHPEYYRPDSLGHIFRYINGEEVIWFDFNIAEGDTYQINLPSLNIHYYVKVLGRDEIVENHAGKFENCLRLFFDDPHQVDDAFELYFCKNVGIVKRVLPHAIVQQLYSAKINGIVYPDTVLSVNPLDEESYPKQIVLFQNYPNPFNKYTVIRYTLLASSQNVQLKIYNIRGEEVITLINEVQTKGHHMVRWAGVDSEGMPVSAGVYLCKLQLGQFYLIKKLLLLK